MNNFYTSVAAMTSSSEELVLRNNIQVPEQNWQALWLLPAALAGVTGNILVCIAVSIDRKLRNVTNYFLVSLAVADLLVSLVVMPCCTIQEFMGYWPLGLEVCGVWQVSDVTLCTSSIMHLCIISIDRFIGIRNPMVARNRSPWVVGVKIGLAWMMSLLIASPLFFVVHFRPQQVMDPKVKHCSIMNRPFLVYGSVVAFFVPLVIMLVTYTLSMRLLTKQVKLLSKDNFSCDRVDTREPSVINDLPPTQVNDPTEPLSRSQSAENLSTDKSNSGYGGERLSSPLVELRCKKSGMNRSLFSVISREQSPPAREVSSDFHLGPVSFIASSSSSSSHHDFQKRGCKYLLINNSETKLAAFEDRRFSSIASSPRSIADLAEPELEEVCEVFSQENDDSDTQDSSNSRIFHEQPGEDNDKTEPFEIYLAQKHALSRKNDRHVCFGRFFTRPLQTLVRRLHNASQSGATTTSSPTCKTFCWTTPLGSPKIRTAADETLVVNTLTASYRFKSLVHKHSAALRVAGILIAKREKQKRAALNSVRNERKAIRVLGAMFAIFVVCWAPFFSVNLAIGFCTDCNTGSVLFRTCLWFGYVSSTLNPIVYTVFNRSFRKTFLDILLPQRHCCRR